jgi:hypothetical protein
VRLLHVDAEAPASEARPRRVCSGAKRLAIATVHNTGGSGQSSPARLNAWRRTPRSKDAEWATSTRPRIRAASSGSTASGGGAPSTMVCEIPVKRWMPRDSGRVMPTSELQRSCSSPPPTSTAPDFGELAAVARLPVGLRVHGEELGGGEGRREQSRLEQQGRGHGRDMLRGGPDGMHVPLQRPLRR